MQHRKGPGRRVRRWALIAIMPANIVGDEADGVAEFITATRVHPQENSPGSPSPM